MPPGPTSASSCSRTWWRGTTRTGSSRRRPASSPGRCRWRPPAGPSTSAEPAAGQFSTGSAPDTLMWPPAGHRAGPLNSAGMRVLVTGGAGFIGSHLTDAFLARGDEVIVVDDMSTGRAGRVDEHAWLHKLSITDAVSLGEIVRGTRPELICHLAAHIDVRTSVDAPAQDAQVNVLGTVNVLEAARETGARVLFSSSGGILYGRNAGIPS